ncbi:hypothetical protein CEP51_014839, partial [Fusarium floridanum]
MTGSEHGQHLSPRSGITSPRVLSSVLSSEGICRSGIASVVDGQTHTNQVAQVATIDGKAFSAGWDDTLRI